MLGVKSVKPVLPKMDKAGSCGWYGRKRPRYELCNSINVETLMKYAIQEYNRII